MASEGKYVYMVRMDVEPDKEALFNEVYVQEHIPEILKVPGVYGATQYETSGEGQPKYMAMYEMEGPDLPSSPAWKEASDKGRWAPEVRPYTKNRSHVVYKKL